MTERELSKGDEYGDTERGLEVQRRKNELSIGLMMKSRKLRCLTANCLRHERTILNIVEISAERHARPRELLVEINASMQSHDFLSVSVHSDIPYLRSSLTLTTGKSIVWSVKHVGVSL